jgi:hypothetical protein
MFGPEQGGFRIRKIKVHGLALRTYRGKELRRGRLIRFWTYTGFLVMASAAEDREA